MENRAHLHKTLMNFCAYGALMSASETWMSAIEVTNVLKKHIEMAGGTLKRSYRPIAFALRRLAKRGLVQERIVYYRGTARTREERREYCLAEKTGNHPLAALFPPVVTTPPQYRRRIHGRDWQD